MLSLRKALSLVLKHAKPFGLERWEEIELSQALGRVLAEKVYSDDDVPSFDRAAMDGFAVKAKDHSAVFRVIEDIPAGKIAAKRIRWGECARIMTGAMLPKGADLVIPLENVEEIEKKFVKVITAPQKSNVSKKGEDIKKGRVVLRKGKEIRPQEIAVLAVSGKTSIKTYCLPKVSVIATGSELVEPNQMPRLGQIRNSNSPMLLAQLKKRGVNGNYLGTAEDDFEATRKMVENGLTKSDILIISGGVSVGDYDFVKEVLKKCGVEIIFDKIAIKPGRPTTFGIKDGKFIFGLPGNPVSAFIIFELLVAPLIDKLAHKYISNETEKTSLLGDFEREKADCEQYYPAILFREVGAFPINFHGSAHIHALTAVNAFIHLKKGTKKIRDGEIIDVRPI
ncbi:MAG: molybdopterin molybdotransferase MoeA [Candidatus Margulisbacteria bacterium]|nr:molybdopterin molybdotransferase MoeA [Candidatus Margulisiibacteriota bacterium]